VSLRVAGTTDLGLVKQVARLALPENERLYARVEALSKQLAALSRAKAPEQLDHDLLRIREQMTSLQRHTFAEESYPAASEALDLIGEMFLIEHAFPDLRCIADSTQPHFGNP
jgi:hypothetical protein